MTIVKTYNLFNMVFCFLLFVLSTGCNTSPSPLCMDGDRSLEPQSTSGDPVTLLPRNTRSQALNYTPNGIIMGNIGSGKTTLVNMLSNTAHATSSYLPNSVTREIFREPAAYGDHPFRLVDTPGTDGEEEVYRHSFLLKSAYEAMPYNAIFVVVPFHPKSHRIKKEFLQLTRYVKKYQDNVVLMLSHCDRTDQDHKEQIERNVDDLAAQNGIRHTIMYSRKSDRTALANAMYACMSNTPKIWINVTDEDFFLKFKIWDPSELSEAYDKFEEKSESLLSEYLRVLQKESSKGYSDLEMGNLMQALGFSLEDELRQSITDFEEKYGLTMVEFNSYAAHIEMSKKKIQIQDEFLAKTKPIIRWDRLDPNDIRYQIKQCPHCAQFLVKIGCDGVTSCGNVPDGPDRVQKKEAMPWYKYMVKRVNGSLEVAKHELQNFMPIRQPNKETMTFIRSQLKPGAQLGLAGCGGKFRWERIPFLSGDTLKYVIEELNSTKDQAVENVAKAAKQKVKPKSNVEEMGINDEDFATRREAYEARIDTTIKSERGGNM